MTIMMIDNKARCKKSYEYFEVDRNEYNSVNSLMELAYECMNEDVYLIRVCEGKGNSLDNYKELFTMRNHK